ncbi:hypothetical protein [Thermodesulfatator autotrophicus]|uniref:Uncharacterized protein n=1 Tax=Thermodesulfatator autotrophicus TaxID=1795632 RepID=A0A177E946_9BACT|nr:hypothetical protein [Thermodesulfatator autotrophicus]OAG27529.1 hypothetical protein TH606_06475 [Thermodesulfatator autotrophicus]
MCLVTVTTPENDEAVLVLVDLLTGMAILGGLISPEIPLKLVQWRRDIMIESAAYGIIKKKAMKND